MRLNFSETLQSDETMPNPLQIETTLLFAAIFGILHVIFTLRVGGYRFKSKINFGDEGCVIGIRHRKHCWHFHQSSGATVS